MWACMLHVPVLRVRVRPSVGGRSRGGARDGSPSSPWRLHVPLGHVVVAVRPIHTEEEGAGDLCEGVINR